MTIEQRYLDDFLVGERFAAPARTLNDSHFVMFSAVTGDNHPIHYSVEYAREHDLPGPLAHGLLLLGMCALGATPESHSMHAAMIAMLGTDVRYRAPAVVGDTLYPEFEVAEVTPKDATRGILKLTFELRNQSRVTVLDGSHVLMLKRREPLE